MRWWLHSPDYCCLYEASWWIQNDESSCWRRHKESVSNCCYLEMYIYHFGWINQCSPSLADDWCYLHMLLYAVAWLLPGVVNTLPLLQREQSSQEMIKVSSEVTDGLMDGCETHLSFLDTGVDGVQQVSSVLVALGEFSQFLPNQLPLVVAHHPLKRWVHVLRHNQEDEGVKVSSVYKYCLIYVE